MTLAGRNGAGKTTLLRMLAGQSSVDGGELVFEKGARVALHDQRPPRERGLTLRDYVLAGCADLVALEERLRDLEAEMARAARTTRRCSSATPRAQARLEHAGGWDWRDAGDRARCTAWASPTTSSTASCAPSPAAS